VRNARGRAASLLVLLATLMLALTLLGHLTGRLRFVPVLSGSMSPRLPTGSLAVATPVPLDRLTVGDVVIYRIPIGDHHLIVHRIVRIDRAGHTPVIETKGDANSTGDPWRARLSGRSAWVARAEVPLLGYGSIYARSLGPLLLLLALVTVTLSLGLRRIWREPLARHKRRGDPHATLPA
jgi:signal peptidase I